MSFTGFSSNRGYYASWYYEWFSAAYTPIVALQQNEVKGGYMTKAYNQQIFGGSDATVSCMLDGTDDAAIDFAVKNPHIWLNRSNQSWVESENSQQLWGETKTIHDPCPVGWKVPSSKDWKALTTIDAETNVECVAANDIFFLLDGHLFSPLNGRSATGRIDGNVKNNGYGARAHFYCSDATSSSSDLKGTIFNLGINRSYTTDTPLSFQFDMKVASAGSRIRCIKE